MFLKAFINYLQITPEPMGYFSNIKIKNKLSGWFIVSLLSATCNFTKIKDEAGINLSSDNLIQNNVFKLYLNESQTRYVYERNDLFKIDKIEMIKKYKKKIMNQNDYDSFYIVAPTDWAINNNDIIKEKIGDYIYKVNETVNKKKIYSDPNVIDIIPVPKMRILNRYVSGYLQSASSKNVYNNDIFSTLRTIHDRGLNGNGEIISVVDTGIDVFNTMFYDPNNSLQTITNKTNLKHRKVVRIESIIDNLDYQNGHGTHVSGTVAGKALCTDEKCGISLYNGIAPESKLYITDIGSSDSHGDLSGDVNLGYHTSTMRNLKSCISSNSWSFNERIPLETYKYNKAAYDNPKILFVFAVGNDYSYNSINIPSDAKNILTVGATVKPSGGQAESNKRCVTIVDMINNKEFSGTDFKEIIWANSINYPMKYYNDIETIDYSVSSNNYTEKVVFIRDHNENMCSTFKKIAEYEPYAIIYSGEYVQCYGINIPAILIDDKKVFDIKRISIYPYAGKSESKLSISRISSKGPGYSGISKPDVVAPGEEIYSSKSFGKYSGLPIVNSVDALTKLSGTSMATPAISGVLSIILQFFHEKWYPYLKKETCEYIEPSSYLLKAFITCIAEPHIDFQSGPSLEYGFGIPCLENIFQNGLRVVDKQKIKSKSRKSYKISISSSKTNLIFSMAYLDPPLSYQNPSLLFADLNLVVISPSGKRYYGNDIKNADSDSFSTIERIIIQSTEVKIGDYEIHIISSDFPIDEDISFAIVVQGGFEQSNTEINPIFLKEITNQKYSAKCTNGKNVNGFCSCDEGYTGFYCNTKIKTLDYNEYDNSNINYKEIKYYKIKQFNLSKNTYVIELKRSASQSGYYCLSSEPNVITDSSWTCNEFKNGLKINVNVEETPYLAIYVPDYRSVNINVSICDSYYEEYNKKFKNKTIKLFTICIICLFVIIVSIVACLLIHKSKNTKEEEEEDEKNKALCGDDVLI